MNTTIEMEGDQSNTRFRDRPLGNVPKLMSLDKAENKASRDAINRHIYALRHLVRTNDVDTDPKYEFVMLCVRPMRYGGTGIPHTAPPEERPRATRCGHRRAVKPSDIWDGLQEKGSAP